MLLIPVMAVLVVLATPSSLQGETPRDDDWRWTTEARLSASTNGVPELQLSTTLARSFGSIRLEATRDLAQSAPIEIRLSESLRWRDWQLTTETRWQPADTPSATVSLRRQGRWGQAQLAVDAPPAPLGWTLAGRVSWRSVTLDVRNLRGKGTSIAVESATIDWSPDFVAGTLGARYQSAQSPPLSVEMTMPVTDDLTIQMSHRFGPNQATTATDTPPWRWADSLLSVRRAPLDLTLEVATRGWQRLGLGARHELDEAWEGSVGVAFAPSGWRESEVGLHWKPGLTNRIETALSVDPGGWALKPRVNWHASDPTVSLNGSGSLDADGLGSVNLNGRWSDGPISIDGLYNKSGRTWTLDLAAKADVAPWTIRVKSSWLAPLGWDQGSVRLGRTWAWPNPHGTATDVPSADSGR